MSGAIVSQNPTALLSLDDRPRCWRDRFGEVDKTAKKRSFSHATLSYMWNNYMTHFYAVGSNPGRGMGVCKCIMPSRHGGTLNIRRAASPLVGLRRGSAFVILCIGPNSIGSLIQKAITTEIIYAAESRKPNGGSLNQPVTLTQGIPSCVFLLHNRLTLLPFKYFAANMCEGTKEWMAVQQERPSYKEFDEAHFWLNGYVNKQNCRISSEANPQVYVETPLHPEKLTVWCALWADGIIGPFFKNDEGHNVTVSGDRYRAMITNFFIPELNNHDVQELWFQQDGATCRTARATIDLLKDTFRDRLISRFGPVNQPPRSYDLTPLDYFLWGYVKSLVYADKPQTLDHLEDNIRRVIADIRPQMLKKVIENWTFRLDYILVSRGSQMPEILFKMKCHKIIFRIKKIHVNRIIHRCFIAI
ncbi:putative transposase [Trichonephila clavipes]|nr:putative transposase [Trichonephila clavipes]